MPELRKSGIDVVGEIPWGSHFCNFYETKQDLLDTLVPYFKTGLESKEFCLWIVSNSGLITVEDAKKAFEQVVPDFERHLSNGNIEILNETDWYLKDNVFNLEKVINEWHVKLKRALALGYHGMRASGDTFWLSENNWDDFFDYEKQVSDSISGVPMTILCTYPLAKSGAAEILDVAHNHQFAIARRKGELEVIETSMQIQAQAEIKRLSEELQRFKDRTHKPPLVLRYVVALLSVSASLIITLWMQMELGHESTPIVSMFLCAIMFSAWFGGIGPGLLALALSTLSFDYFFVPPVNSWAVEIKEIPRIIIFILSALLVGFLSVAQRNIAESLRKARDVLNGTVQKLRQTNATLREEIAERKQAEDALRKSEDRIRFIIDTIPIMAWTSLPDGTIDFANQRWLDYAGKGANEDPNRIIHPEDLQHVREKWLVNKAAGKAYEDELRLRRTDGEYRWFLVRTAPLYDEQENIVKWYGVSIDIEDSKRAEKILQQSYEEIRRLTVHLQSIREEERTSIAREIHDELGQQLTAIKMDVAWIDKKTPEETTDIKRKLKNITALLDGSNQSIRKILSELRSQILDEDGLSEAIEWLARQFYEATGIPVKFTTAEKDIKVPEQVATCIFRVCQEAFTNITRYSLAKNVSISIDIIEENIVVIIEDDGIGFDTASVQNKKTFGILGMKERVLSLGGRFELISSPGKGTKIAVSLPYKYK